MPMNWTARELLAAWVLMVASIALIGALLLPPQGEISQSVLVAIAQFLVFAATLLGVDVAVNKIKELLKKE